jgi:hypothetical protein
MNTLLFNYSRIASIFMAFICLPMIANSQIIEAEYLSSYHGEGDGFFVEKVVYAEPYYLFLGREDQVAQIRYLQYDNGALTESFRIVPFEDEPLDQKRFIHLGANQEITFLVILDEETQILLWFDHSNGADAIIHSANIESDVRITEFAFGDHALHAMRYGDEVNLISMIFNEEYSSVRQVNNLINYDGFNPGELGCADGEILIGDRYGDLEQEYNGLLRFRLDENDHLVMNAEPFLAHENATIVKTIIASHSYVLLETDNASVWQWSNAEEPQKLLSFSVEFGHFYAALSEKHLVMLPAGGEKYSLYTKESSGYSDPTKIPFIYRSLALGPELLIQYGDGGVVAHDIISSSYPTQIPLTFAETQAIRQVKALGNYLYVFSNDTISVLDAADPAAPMFINDIAQDHYFIYEAQYLTFVPLNLSGNTSYENRVIHTVNPDGSLGDEQLPPLLTEEEKMDGLSTPSWNEDVFVQPVRYNVERQLPLGSDEFVKLYLYEIIDTQIAETYSGVIEGASSPLEYAIDGDLLYIANAERDKSVSIYQPDEYFLNVHVYSIADISNPQFISKISIKQDGFSYPFLSSLIVRENWLVLNTFDKAYLFNVSDSQALKYVPSPEDISGLYYWYKGYWFEREMSKGVTVYKPTSEGFVKVAVLPILEAWNMDIKDDYLYVAHRNRGLDIYKLTFDNSNTSETYVSNWALY